MQRDRRQRWENVQERIHRVLIWAGCDALKQGEECFLFGRFLRQRTFNNTIITIFCLSALEQRSRFVRDPFPCCACVAVSAVSLRSALVFRIFIIFLVPSALHTQLVGALLCFALVLCLLLLFFIARGAPIAAPDSDILLGSTHPVLSFVSHIKRGERYFDTHRRYSEWDSGKCWQKRKNSRKIRAEEFCFPEKTRRRKMLQRTEIAYTFSMHFLSVQFKIHLELLISQSDLPSVMS